MNVLDRHSRANQGSVIACRLLPLAGTTARGDRLNCSLLVDCIIIFSYCFLGCRVYPSTTDRLKRACGPIRDGRGCYLGNAAFEQEQMGIRTASISLHCSHQLTFDNYNHHSLNTTTYLHTRTSYPRDVLIPQATIRFKLQWYVLDLIYLAPR